MRVVAFTGMPGAGKSEAVEEARRRKLPILAMGDFVRESTRARGLDLTDENLGRVATEARRTLGPDCWARATADQVLSRWNDAPLVIIDGVRTLAEIEHFRKRLGAAFRLVAIEAALPVRVHRLRARARSDDATTPELVRRRDEREIGWGLDQAIASADERLVNHGSLPEFRADVRRLFDRLVEAA